MELSSQLEVLKYKIEIFEFYIKNQLFIISLLKNKMCVKNYKNLNFIN